MHLKTSTYEFVKKVLQNNAPPQTVLCNGACEENDPSAIRGGSPPPGRFMQHSQKESIPRPSGVAIGGAKWLNDL